MRIFGLSFVCILITPIYSNLKDKPTFVVTMKNLDNSGIADQYVTIAFDGNDITFGPTNSMGQFMTQDIPCWVIKVISNCIFN